MFTVCALASAKAACVSRAGASGLRQAKEPDQAKNEETYFYLFYYHKI